MRPPYGDGECHKVTLMLLYVDRDVSHLSLYSAIKHVTYCISGPLDCIASVQGYIRRNYKYSIDCSGQTTGHLRVWPRRLRNCHWHSAMRDQLAFVFTRRHDDNSTSQLSGAGLDFYIRSQQVDSGAHLSSLQGWIMDQYQELSLKRVVLVSSFTIQTNPAIFVYQKDNKTHLGQKEQ